MLCSIIERCTGAPDDFIEDEDFDVISEFSTPDTIGALGTASIKITREVFSENSRSITEIERQNERSSHDGDELHDSRGLSDTADLGGKDTGTAREMGDDEEKLPERGETGPLLKPHREGETIRTSPRDSEEREINGEADDDGTSLAESGTGQREGSDGLGSSHEHAPESGGGSDRDGTYQQLTLSALFPTEQEQKEEIEAEENRSSAFFVPETQENPKPLSKEADIPAVNFRIRSLRLGEGSAKSKYQRNIAAIRLLKSLEEKNRNATPEEQEILSQYVGWGGLLDAFDERKSEWKSEYDELKILLTDKEYEAARASTLNAHYTSPVVISAVYDALDR